MIRQPPPTSFTTLTEEKMEFDFPPYSSGNTCLGSLTLLLCHQNKLCVIYIPQELKKIQIALKAFRIIYFIYKKKVFLKKISIIVQFICIVYKY